MKVAHELETPELSQQFILENTHKMIIIVDRKTEFGNYKVIPVSTDEDIPTPIIITESVLEKFSKSPDYHIIYS